MEQKSAIMTDKERAQATIEFSKQFSFLTPGNFEDNAVRVSRAYLDALDEIERLRERMRFLIHIVDDPSYTLRQIQDIGHQALEGVKGE